MKPIRRCTACKAPFEVDQRNQDRHRYCSGPVCQRERRRHAQEKRRLAARRKLPDRGANRTLSRLRAKVRPPQRSDALEDPLLVGLIAILTGAQNMDEVRESALRFAKRGKEIIGNRHPPIL